MYLRVFKAARQCTATYMRHPHHSLDYSSLETRGWERTTNLENSDRKMAGEARGERNEGTGPLAQSPCTGDSSHPSVLNLEEERYTITLRVQI